MAPSVTKVSYYILGAESVEDRIRFAIKFVRQSWRKGMNVHCHVPSQVEAEELDQLMWEDNESFVPHEVEQGVLSRAPVGIGWQDPAGRDDLFVNLGGNLPAWFSHFNHLIEVVVQDPKVLETTRANWKQLKFNGYPITKHDLRS